MILKIIQFELKFWKSRAITYVFPLVVFVFTLLLLTIKNVTFGSDIVYRNAPSSLNVIYFLFVMFLPLFVNSFVSSGVTRDYENKFDQIIYSLPVPKYKILLGRFAGGVIVVSFMFIGILLADLLAKFMPWANKDLLGPLRLDSHLQNYVSIALPNIIIIGSILFLIASWTKSINYSFLAAIAMVIFYLSFQNLTDKIDNKTLGALIDPYGFLPIDYYTKKWTAFEKNTLLYQVDWKFWANRAIWFGFSFLLWILALKNQKLKTSTTKITKKNTKEETAFVPKAFSIEKDFSFKYALKNLHQQAKIDFKHIVKSPTFIIVLGLILMILGMEFAGNLESDNSGSIATTSNTIGYLRSVATMMKLAIIFFSGMLIWKERDNKANEIYDSLPINTSLIYGGKLLSIFYLMGLLSAILIVLGVLYQWGNGITDIDFSHYFAHFFGIEIFQAMTLAVLSMLLQILINNKFTAYFISSLLLIAEPFLLEWVDINSKLFGLSPRIPSYVFSDFYGYGSYKTTVIAHMIYWIMVYTLIAFASYLFFIRGKINTWKERFAAAKMRFSDSKLVFYPLLLMTVLYGSFMLYQTKFVNTYFSKKERLTRMSYYEKNFKKYENLPTPKVTHVDYTIDLMPDKRAFNVQATLNMVNSNDTIIDKIYVNNDLRFPYKINIQGAKLVNSDKNSMVNFETYQFDKPLQIGDSVRVNYTYHEAYSGIENEVNNERLMDNGSFLDFANFTPGVGYDSNSEIEDKSDREKYGLAVKSENMPALERACGKKCNKDYIGGMSDWATIHSVISTVGDQTAIAPGKLVRTWKQDNRNFFEYNLTQPSKFFFSVVSGTFEVLKDSTNGVSCEVYYLKNHKYNVPEMMKSLKKSISYYSQNYGPYKHHEARIIEFPRFSSFAQSFPGTMPYSEGIGFTTNLVKNKEDINEVFHVVAHEMAHQWWAHQVTGAYMQGATLMSESLSEYSSLKLLEKEYGIDMTAKFLKESNNGYIFRRAGEEKKESALYQVDNQPYIHYQKGSVVLYGIQQLIGEQKMNEILSKFDQKYAYQPKPYPNAYNFLDIMYPMIPDSLKETAKDGLERIIIYNTDIKSATTVQLKDKTYETTVEIELLKNSVDPDAKQTKNIKDMALGQSKEAPISDYFDIGLFEENGSKARYGKLISTTRVKLDKKSNTLKLISKTKPNKFVFDPYFIHIYKDPEDNVKKI